METKAQLKAAGRCVVCADGSGSLDADGLCEYCAAQRAGAPMSAPTAPVAAPTAGPWRAMPVTGIVAAGGTPILSAADCHLRGVGGTRAGNLRLAAAAPDMLAALELVLASGKLGLSREALAVNNAIRAAKGE